MDFFKRIEELVESKGTSLCIGLDPYFSREDRARRGDETCLGEALKANLRIIESTHPYAACYKPNVAFYEAFGPAGLGVLRKNPRCHPGRYPCDSRREAR